jgi:hypothetical protein
MGEKNMYTVLVGHMKERDHMEDLSADDRIILKQILKELGAD